MRVFYYELFGFDFFIEYEPFRFSYHALVSQLCPILTDFDYFYPISTNSKFLKLICSDLKPILIYLDRLQPNSGRVGHD